MIPGHADLRSISTQVGVSLFHTPLSRHWRSCSPAIWNPSLQEKKTIIPALKSFPSLLPFEGTPGSGHWIPGIEWHKHDVVSHLIGGWNGCAEIWASQVRGVGGVPYTSAPPFFTPSVCTNQRWINWVSLIRGEANANTVQMLLHANSLATTNSQFSKH